MKKIVFSLVFALALLFSANGQYKNAVSIDPFSYSTINLEYERFVFSKDIHHFSLKGLAGYGIAMDGWMTGVEAVYGLGNNHRVEVGFGGTFIYSNRSDAVYNYFIGGFRLNYAYYSKSNPLVYRIGWMPLMNHELTKNAPSEFKTNYDWNTITIGIGYRF